MNEEMILEKMVELLVGSSKSGWLGLSIAVPVSLLLGYLYVKIRKSRNNGAEETENLRHTASSQTVTENVLKEREHAQAEAAVEDFLRGGGDGIPRKTEGGGAPSH